jgi:hypothetical protein
MEFEPGSSHTATLPVAVTPTGLACEVELWLSTDGETKAATSGLVPFTSTGAQQQLSLVVAMPSQEGTYQVLIDLYCGGSLIGAYQALENISIKAAGTFILTVKFIQSSTVVETNVITDNQGDFSIDITPGTYNICVKSPRALSRRVNNVQFIAGQVTEVNFGTLLEGDANNDDVIDINDFGLLSDAFGSVPSDANWDDRCDFNRDGVVNIYDYGLLADNFGLAGACYQVNVITVDLVAGKNIIVFEGSTRDIAPAFAGYEDKIIAVWYQDPTTGNWLGYSPSGPDWANDLHQLVKGKTYTINAAVDCQWSYTK